MSTEQNKAIIRRTAEDLARGNLAIADQSFAPGFVYHAPGGVEVRGPEGVKEFVAALPAAFPDLRATVEDQIAEGDRVATRVVYTGTHQGEFQGIAPTGKQVSWTQTWFDRMAGNQTEEAWGDVDMLGLLQQLGAAPAPAATGSAEANRALVRRLVEEVRNRWDFALIDELVAPEVTYRGGLGDVSGREAFREMLRGVQAAFPDSVIVEQDLLTDADRAMMRYIVRGTHRGEFLGVPPTGKELSITGMIVWRITAGTIAEIWENFDALGMMQQLGALPAPAPATV